MGYLFLPNYATNDSCIMPQYPLAFSWWVVFIIAVIIVPMFLMETTCMLDPFLYYKERKLIVITLLKFISVNLGIDQNNNADNNSISVQNCWSGLSPCLAWCNFASKRYGWTISMVYSGVSEFETFKSDFRQKYAIFAQILSTEAF